MPVENIYLWAHGGLGDVAWTYLFSEHFRKLSSLRSSNISSKIKAVVISYNPQAAELMRFNPLLDEVEFRSPQWEQRDKKMTIADIVKQYSAGYTCCNKISGYNKLSYTTQKVYLSPDKEPETINRILARGPFVIMHPFAGIEKRRAGDSEDWVETAEYIIDKLKKNVVILGGTHQRRIATENIENSEFFKGRKSGIFNLVDRTTSRVGLKLLQEADACIGTWSCWATLAWGLDKKTILITKEENRKGIDFVSAGKYRNYKRNYHKNLFLEHSNQHFFPKVKEFLNGFTQ